MSGGREWQGFKVKKPDERDIIRLNLNLRTENFRYSVCKLATDHAGYLALFDFCRYKATKAIYSAVTLLNLSFFVYLRLPQSILIMTDRTEQNAEALFVAARKGDKYAFFKLIPGFYKDIYSLIFRVMPDNARAEEVLKDIFVLAADNIAHVKEDRDVFEWLRKLSIIVTLYDLRDHPLYNGREGEFPPRLESFSEIERLYASLTDIERVVLTLYLQFDYSPATISGFISGESEEGINSLLSSKLERLCYFSSRKELVTHHKDDFYRLIRIQGAMLADDELNKEGIDPEVSGLFIEFIDSCCNLFPDITVRESILEDIRDELINEDKIKARKSRKKEAMTVELNKIAETTARQGASPITLKAGIAVRKMTLRTSMISSWNLIISLIVIAVLAGAVWGYMEYSKYNTPWKLAKVSGDVSVNGTSETEVNTGDALTTGPASSVELIIPDQANIKLQANSLLTLISGHKESNEFEYSGPGFNLLTRLDTTGFVEFADIPPFRIKIPGYEILTEVANLVYDSAAASLHLHFGWADVKGNGDITFLSSGYSVDLSPGLKLHVPLYESADSAQKARIVSINSTGINDASLSDFIIHAQQQDALSLLYLISKTTKVQREKIASKMEEMFPAVDDEVKKGLINEDPDTILYVKGFLQWLMLFN